MSYEAKDCFACGGAGWYERTAGRGDCPYCEGTGKTSKETNDAARIAVKADMAQDRPRRSKK